MSDTVTEPKNALERYIAWTAKKLIDFRWLLGIAFFLVTVGLGYSLKDLRFDTSFTKFIPQNHPYMSAFLKNFDTFSGANRLMVNVRWKVKLQMMSFTLTRKASTVRRSLRSTPLMCFM